MPKIAIVKYENIGTYAMTHELSKTALDRHHAIIESLRLVEYKPTLNTAGYVGKRLSSVYILKYKSGQSIGINKQEILETLLADLSLIEDAKEYKFIRTLDLEVMK